MIAFRLRGGLGDCGSLVWPFEGAGLAKRDGHGLSLRFPSGIEEGDDLGRDISGALAVIAGA